MSRSTFARRVLPGLVAAAVTAGALSARAGASAPLQDPADPTPVPVGASYQAGDACYYRLPDLPERRYGGFGGYNPETGVLTYAGGAVKLSADNTEAHHDLFAIRLDGRATSWTTIPYNANVGYTRERDKGCREGASVMLSPSRWLSVFGKDGCDNGAFDSGKKGGDLKELAIGDAASSAAVKWVANSGAQSLPAKLKEKKGNLIRLFATFDTKRSRLIFGQGTFDDEKDVESEDRIYAATVAGSKWQIREITPSGAQQPIARFGTCAAYVNDPDTGVDGVIVLGGQQGGLTGTTSYKEVWWLDFATSTNGVWSEITGRFANIDEIGFRREGACAYDPATKTFTSWMGRADSKIPGGASHSAGIWTTDLSQLGDASASLTWVKVAQDNQGKALSGRRLIPSVYDFANDRFFVIGGRVGDDALADVWAIYPGVTGDACANLDPYAPFSSPSTPTTPPTAPTTTTPGTPGTPTPTTPTPTAPPPNTDVVVCDSIQGKVPAAAIAQGAGNPDGVSGWMELCHPNLPASPYNALRRFLDVRNPGAPYHPIYNSLVFRCGCR